MGLCEVPSRSRGAAAEGVARPSSVSRRAIVRRALDVVRRLQRLGFTVQATSGTAAYLRNHRVDAETVHKVKEGRPHIVDHIKNGQVALVVNTVSNASSHADSLSIRREALNKGLAYYTTIRGARAAVMGIEAILKKELTIRSLQEYHGTGRTE